MTPTEYTTTPPPEPSVTVNGTVLTEAQAMTVRVALQSMDVELERDGLGGDQHGRRLTAIYLTAIREINALISPGADA